MKILSSFTQPHVIPDVYNLLSSVEHKRRYFEFLFSIELKSVLRSNVCFFYYIIYVLYQKIILCSVEEIHMYRIGMTPEWVNDYWLNHAINTSNRYCTSWSPQEGKTVLPFSHLNRSFNSNHDKKWNGVKLTGNNMLVKTFGGFLCR